MSAEEHLAIMARLDSLHDLTVETRNGVREQNGRVRKCEAAIAALNWAVYIGGSTMISVVLYLIYKHMVI